MISFDTQGLAKTVLTVLANTNATTIYSVPPSVNATVDSIRVCNVTGSAATITLTISDGTTSARLLGAKSVAANDAIQIDGHSTPMSEGWSLTATAGTGSALEITTVIVERQSTR